MEEEKKGQFQLSYLVASLTHHSVLKPADIKIMVGNYEGEDITYGV